MNNELLHQASLAQFIRTVGICAAGITKHDVDATYLGALRLDRQMTAPYLGLTLGWGWFSTHVSVVCCSTEESSGFDGRKQLRRCLQCWTYGDVHGLECGNCFRI